MPTPNFQDLRDASQFELLKLLRIKVRAERSALKLSQAEFAKKCDVPLRTYKRFELGESNSLELFIKIVIVFNRVVALDLLFPPKPIEIQIRTPLAALERAKQRRDQRAYKDDYTN